MNNNNENIVSSFFFYMWNTWCKEECQKVFGSMYEHFWSKWCSLATPSASGSSEKFYSALSKYNRRLLVNRACEVYDGAGLRRSQETTQIIYRCDNCGSTDVRLQAWVDPNNDNRFIGKCDDDKNNICEDCESPDVKIVAHSEFMKNTVNYWWEQCNDEDREVISGLEERDYGTEKEYEDACNTIWNAKTDEEKIAIWNQIVNREENE